MNTSEIILALIQCIVVPLVAWMCLQIVSNIRSIGVIETTVKALDERLDLYWELIGVKAVKTLHSPHTPEFDHLLDRWLETTNGIPNAIPMSLDELRRFVHKLELAEAEKGDHFRSHQAAVLRAIVLAKHPELKEKKT